MAKIEAEYTQKLVECIPKRLTMQLFKKQGSHNKILTKQLG